MTEKQTIVVKDGGGGSTPAVMLGIIAIIVVLAAGWYFLMGPGSGSKTQSNTNDAPTINVQLPSAAPNAS